MSLTIMVRIEAPVNPSSEIANRLRGEYLHPSAQQMYIRLLKGGEFLDPQRKLQGKDTRGLNHFPEKPYDMLQEKWVEERKKVDTTVEAWAKAAAKATKGLITTVDPATAGLLKEAFSGWGVPMGEELQPEAMARGFGTTFHQNYCGDNKEQGMAGLARQLINTFGEKYNIDHLNYGISDVERDVLLVLEGMQGWLAKFYGSESMQKAFSACIKAELAAYAKRLTRVDKSVWEIDLLDEHVEILRTFGPKVSEGTSSGVDESTGTIEEPLPQPLPTRTPVDARPLRSPESTPEASPAPFPTPVVRAAEPPRTLAQAFARTTRSRGSAPNPEPAPVPVAEPAPDEAPAPVAQGEAAAVSRSGVTVGVLERENLPHHPVHHGTGDAEALLAAPPDGQNGAADPDTIRGVELIQPNVLDDLLGGDPPQGIQERSPEKNRADKVETLTTEHQKFEDYFAIRAQILSAISEIRKDPNTAVDLEYVFNKLHGNSGDIVTHIWELSQSEGVSLAELSDGVEAIMSTPQFVGIRYLNVHDLNSRARDDIRKSMKKVLKELFGGEIRLPNVEGRVRMEEEEIRNLVMGIMHKLGISGSIIQSYESWVAEMNNMPLLGDQLYYLITKQSELREKYHEVRANALREQLAGLDKDVPLPLVGFGRRTRPEDDDDENGEGEPDSPFGPPPPPSSYQAADPRDILSILP